MSSIDAINLTTKNVFQGTLISCKESSISKETKELLKDSRAIRSTRNKPVSKLHLLLILSQDCDISNTNDHFIEVIVIKKVSEKKVGKLQQKNRNYRKLQLPYEDDYWLCEAGLISVVNKNCLAGDEIEVVGTLNAYSKGILIDWRIGRYDRVPFPDKFNRYFIGKCLKGPESDFEDFLVKFRKEVIDLYIFVDPKNEEQADEYAVSITALLSEECSFKNESIIEDYIRRQCQNLHKSEIPFNMMQIDSSFAPKELLVPQDFVLKMSGFSFLDATVLRRITLDYLCYHDTEEQKNKK